MGAITRVLAAGIAALAPILALAADPETARTASEAFRGGRRVALEYLRTGNLDLASMALEMLAERWNGVRANAGDAADPELAQALTRTEDGLAAARAALDTGDADAARARLEAAGEGLDAWRKAHGVRIFADCIREVNAAFAALDALRRDPAQAVDAAAAAALGEAAAWTQQTLTKCHAEAPAEIRDEPAFRRLVDGFLASLGRMPEALARRDRDTLHRLMIEQRSFDRLLAFRFG